MQLLNYQTKQLAMLRDGVARKTWTQMLMSPTGSGKTEVAKAIIKGAYGKGRRAWFIVDGVKLLDQPLALFMADGITAGAIQSNHPLTDHSLPIQVIDRAEGPEHSDLTYALKAAREALASS